MNTAIDFINAGYNVTINADGSFTVNHKETIMKSRYTAAQVTAHLNQNKGMELTETIAHKFLTFAKNTSTKAIVKSVDFAAPKAAAAEKWTREEAAPEALAATAKSTAYVAGKLGEFAMWAAKKEESLRVK